MGCSCNMGFGYRNGKRVCLVRRKAYTRSDGTRVKSSVVARKMNVGGKRRRVRKGRKVRKSGVKKVVRKVMQSMFGFSWIN